MRKFFVIGALAVVTLIGCRSNPASTPTPSAPGTVSPAPAPATDPTFIHAYEGEMKAALAPYRASPQTADVGAVKTAVLAITVPKEYLATHLQVVVALTQIEDGRRNDDSSLEAQGSAKLNALAADHAWLR